MSVKTFLKSTYMTSATFHLCLKNCAILGHQTGLSAFAPDELMVAVVHPLVVLQVHTSASFNKLFQNFSRN